jgi:hypothetical protein
VGRFEFRRVSGGGQPRPASTGTSLSVGTNVAPMSLRSA